MIKKLIRKMQTASGGPIRRIKFTPELIAEFENQSVRVPGTNNSGGNRYRDEGALAQQHLEQETKRKEEERLSRMEMRPTLKRKAEKLGDKDEYELKPQIVGMSGADPLLSFYVGGVGLNGIGALAKTGLWNIVKYAPTTQLGNWGRGYFVGNAFKNSFNGTVPTLTSQATSLLYLPAKLNKTGLTSLKFFERPSKISEVERAGVPKVERNQPFKEKQLTEHVQGDEAVKMFKEYGGEPIPEGSINGELLRKYVAEARERYGLTNNKNITDKEIALALYKHSKELGGNTAAINAQGEPQLLFRGDTRRYTLLKERISPEELATRSGTMDNSLGNLFLGELPGTAGKRTKGLERYLVTGHEFLEKRLEGSGTGSRAVMPDGTFVTEFGGTISEFPKGSYHLVTYNTKHGPNTYYKLPSSYSESGVNDINAFVVRTPQMRDASKEISVLNDDFMVKGGPKVEYHGPIRREVLDKDGFPLIVDEKGNVVADGLAGSSDRQAMAQHYRYVLNDAKAKKQGLLKSKGETDGEPGNYLRDEHDDYSYFALPNFNIQGAKHLLPYDLRIPRNWKDKNIYRGLIPLTTGYTLYNLFSQPLQQSQYLKQGGKINAIEFLQKGKPITIPKNLKTVKTIKINNGTLTGKIDKNNNVYWFRNDKYITPNQMKTYKYYDSKIKAYRRLGNRDEYVRKLNKDLINTLDTLATPVITPNIDKLFKLWNTNIENKTEEDYRQSIPFNGEHITLRTKGNMNLTDVPINLLDSIAINSGRSNTNFWKNAALIGKESTFGGYSKYLGRPIYPEAKFTPESLTSNHVYFLNEYDDYLTELGKKYNYDDVLDDNSRIKAEENAKYALEHKLIKDRNPHYSNYVLADAFKRYASNPARYNPGLKNYIPMINNIELELKEEKQLQNYWNTRGKEFYNKGLKEGIGTMKQGGKMIRKGQNGFKYLEKQTDWFPKYKYTASTFSNMKNNLGIYFLNKHPNYPISKYKPTKGNPNNTYYSIPNLKYDVARNLSRAYLTNKPLKSFDEVYNDNKSGTSRETGAVNLGKYHVSTGQDEKGRYISYYDKYDWNLLEQMGLKGNSFEIYDRIYEDEWPEIYLKIFLNKQGGMLQLLKKGSGIHIKKKNRGKFTSYCGGKVTDECIRKAKASSNPVIRKRATFAANARKWKHLEGGVLLLLIFALEGTKLNFFLKAGNFLNSELGKNLVSGIMNGVLDIINTNEQLELYNEYLNFLEENYKYEKSKNIAEKYKRALLNKSDLSDIVNANSAYIEANALNDDTEFNLLKQYYLNLIKQNQQQGYYNAFVGLGNSVIGMLNSNKNASPSTTNKA